MKQPLLAPGQSQTFRRFGAAPVSEELRNREMGIMGIKVRRVHLRMKNIKYRSGPLFPWRSSYKRGSPKPFG